MAADLVYRERAMLAALLARTVLAHGGKAGVRGHEPDPDPNWDPEFWTVLLIDLPTGQVSWHLHDSDKDLVEGLPAYVGHWDGHTTDEKLQRVLQCEHATAAPVAVRTTPKPTYVYQINDKHQDYNRG